MSTENASALAEGQLLPADTTQQNVTETENPEQQVEERRFTQTELEEKLQKRLAKEKRQSEASRQELLREIEALKQPKTAESKTEGAPKRDDFSSYEDFVEARAEWKAEQKALSVLDERETASKKKADEAAKAKSSREFQSQIDDVIESGRKSFADFDSVINGAVKEGLLPTSGALFEAIVEMGESLGDKVFYHLAKHPKEAERIFALSNNAGIRELGKLEDKLSAKKEPRETMEPIGGRTTNASGLRDDMSMDAYDKMRRKQTSTR